MKPLLYIAGPITGHPDYQASFRDAWGKLLGAGYAALNPAHHYPKRTPLRRGEAGEPTWHDWMRPALTALASVDGVALLPGWEDSDGASWEQRIAEAVLGIPVLPIDEWLALGGRFPRPDECWEARP